MERAARAWRAFQWSDLDRRVVIVDPDPAQHAFGMGVVIFAMAARGVVVVPTASPEDFGDPPSERVIPALRVERKADVSSDALQALGRAQAQHRALLASPREGIVLDEVEQSGMHGSPPDPVIVRGPIGPDAWPMRPQWVGRIKKVCDEAGVAFAFMGWGTWVPC